MTNTATLRAHLAVGTALAALILIAPGGRNAEAGSCSPSTGTNILCEGAADPDNDQPQFLSGGVEGGGPVAVTTAFGFGIDTSKSAGNALTITGEGGLSFDDTNAQGSPITGKQDGIDAGNWGSGNLVIITKGQVTGVEGDGVDAFNSFGTDKLTISAAGVSGGDNGIDARNYGTGDLSITATGTVSGGSGDGIVAYGFDVDSDLTISAAGVSGADAGIRARIGSGGEHEGGEYEGGDLPISVLNDVAIESSTGTGVLSITATGVVTGGTDPGIDAINYGGGGVIIDAQDTVTSDEDDGISARNEAGSGGLTISAAGVSAAKDGIYAVNYGSGDLVVTASGPVTGGEEGIEAFNYNGGSLTITAKEMVSAGESGWGIEARNDVSGADLTISAASVSGDDYGIRALNNGTGDLSITATGMVVAGQYDGIRAQNSGANLTISAAAVSGGRDGIRAVNLGTGDLTITTTGVVTGTTDDGISVRNSTNGNDLTISAAGVSGNNFGIDARNEGAGDLSITATGMVTGGGEDGIWARNYGGSLTVSATGVSGIDFGINARNEGTGDTSITATGMVTGAAEDGILAYSYGGSLTVSAAGVSGNVFGINARNYGTGDTSITATGTVTGGSSDGIFAYGFDVDADLTISAAGVSGGGAGIRARIGSGGEHGGGEYGGGDLPVSVLNEVAIESSTGTGVLSITTTGVVTGGTDPGIDAINYGGGGVIIDAQDTVTSDADDGISAKNGVGSGELTISAAGVSGAYNGIYAANQASGDLAITATGVVTGGVEGISGFNYNGGSLTITATQMVAGVTGNGIEARNDNSGTDLTVSAAGVSGSFYGIRAGNNGTGDLSITATDMVAAAQYDGIRAENNGANLTISAAAVSGGRDGILALNFGTGDLAITTTGLVTGTTDDGIDAYNGINGADLTVSAASVSGGTYGIRAFNNGTGDLSITAMGPVTAGSSEGIRAENNGANLTISAAAVSGGRDGIQALNFGTGDLSITATDLVNGATEEGIEAYNGVNGANLTVSAASVSGSTFGIVAGNFGTGDLSVSATGTVTGGSLEGIAAYNAATGGSLTISAAAVSGGVDGIDAVNLGTGDLTITANGLVTGAADNGIDAYNGIGANNFTISAAAVDGSEDGIDARNASSGDFSITATGLVAGGTDDGISARNSSNGTDLTISAASVSGGDSGIDARNYGTGDLSITATGLVTATGNDGIRAENSGGSLTISAAGISGGDDGIDARNYGSGALSVSAEGTVTGATDDGIVAVNSFNGTDLTISAAGVIGGDDGIKARNFGSGDLLITATGTVTGTNGDGIFAYGFNVDADLTISAAAVSGDEAGIGARIGNAGEGENETPALENVIAEQFTTGTGLLSITATGVVTGGTDSGIDAINYGGGGVIIDAQDTVTSDADDGIYAKNGVGSGHVTISAAGVAGGTRGINAFNYGGGDLEIVTTGQVTGGSDEGIVAQNFNGGALSITATDTVSSAFFDGIFAKNGPGGTELTISAAGVSGATQGLFALNYGSGDLAVTASGPVTGGLEGISGFNYNGGSLTITATDMVTAGATGNGIEARNDVSGADLTVSAASVSGGTYGIRAGNNGTGDLAITTTGQVTAGSSDGIRAENNGANLTISAAAVNGGRDGIQALNFGTGDLTITATGLVTGATEEGIDAYNGINGADLTVSAASVSGGAYGIRAVTFGTGNLSVTAKDTVSGGSLEGIAAYNAATGGSLTISAAAVSGGADGIDAVNLGTGDLTITADGLVTGATDNGIDAYNGINGQNFTISVAAVNGGEDGIDARNFSSGDFSITATGLVAGGTDDGIFAKNSSNGTDLTISAAGVIGGDDGINARNFGAGDLSITTTGQVTGGSGAGIGARNYNGGDITVAANDTVSSAASDGIRAFNDFNTGALTISAAGVSGVDDGIDARNYGTGDLSISAKGTVTGATGDGIFSNNSSNGTDLTISAADVRGGDDGIDARNYGSGALSVTTSGSVAGQSAYGIFAYNETNGTDLTISATAVEGGLDGITALNDGAGALSISAMGTVTGQTSYGILAFNSSSGTDLTVSASDVDGGSRGIAVLNEGTGAVSITATGTVDGITKAGIGAYNSSNGTDLKVIAAGVSGGQDGIYAANFGTGALAIEATGSVTGTSAYGIFARLGKDGSGLTINVANVAGGNDAVLIDNQGTAPASVTVSGTVSGGFGSGIRHISVEDNGNSQIEITETGSVSSASGVAIQDGNGATSVISRGALAGSVEMNGGKDQLALIAGSATGSIKMGSNDDTIEIFGLGAGGAWDDSGFTGVFTNNLGQVLDLDGGGGVDTVELLGVTAASQALGTVSNIETLALSAGTLLQANNADLTSFGSVFIGAGSVLQGEGNSPSNSTTGSLGNEGVIDLLDGEANDTLTIQGDFAGGTGSVVQLDLDTDNNTSDSLIIEGDVTDVSFGSFVVENSQTTIVLNVIGDGLGGQTGGDGIRLIEIEGDVDDGDFVLDGGSFDLGLLEYDLVISGGSLFLDSAFFAPVYAYENLPGGLQAIGSATVGQLVERTGLRTAAEASSGLWGRAVGLSLESDGDIDNTSGGSFDQTIGFLQAGAEIEVLRRESGTLMVGLMGHWGQSSLDTTDIDGAAAGSADIDLFGGGVNVTWYGARGWYFDNVFQYTAYDVDVFGAGRFGTASTDGYGIALSHEAGYRIAIGDTAALVPQAQLAYQQVDFDDFTDPDGVRVNLEDGDSLVGRLGIAFENSAAIGSALVTGYAEANVLHEFLGDNEVAATAMGDRFALNQDLGGTSAELGFGGTVQVANGVSVFAEIDYTIPFDGGVRGVQALGGVRINLNPPPQ